MHTIVIGSSTNPIVLCQQQECGALYHRVEITSHAWHATKGWRPYHQATDHRLGQSPGLATPLCSCVRPSVPLIHWRLCLLLVLQVWVKYKRSHMPPQSYRISKPSVGVADLLAMPLPASLPSRSSSAWWNQPVTRQPQQHQAWSCFKQGYDPLTGTWDRQQQQQQQTSLESS